MKILITGANGYIGSKLVTKLIDLGNEVFAVDMKVDHIDSRAKIIVANIFDGNNYFELCEKPDVCIHMAWRDGFIHNSPNHILDLSNHFLFLKNMIDSGIQQIAVMGSMHEAGYFVGKMGELESTNPKNLYGIAKDCLRRSLENYCSGKPVVLQWLRAFYMYGDDQFGNSIFCKIRTAVDEGKEWFPFTSGKNQYDFIHVDDLVNEIACSLMQKNISGQINICSGEPISLSEKIEWYISHYNLPIKLEYGKYPDRPYDSPCVYGDDSKIRKIMEEKNNV